LVISLGEADYVSASRLLGASSRRALLVDVLPNIAGPVLVLATLDLGNAVLLLAGLSFLGLGAQPPAPEWGSMVNTGTQYFQRWLMGPRNSRVTTFSASAAGRCATSAAR